MPGTQGYGWFLPPYVAGLSRLTKPGEVLEAPKLGVVEMEKAKLRFERADTNDVTFAQLRRYIASIRSSGYAAEELTVKLYAKTSWPAISLVMALIALPFAFRIGKRGALYGFGIALVLGIVYWIVFAIFTKFGEVGNLPAVLSAWSANILFAIAAVYLFLHVDT